MVLKIAGPYITENLGSQGNLEFLGIYLLVSVLSVALASVTYKLIEIPGINIGKKIIEEISKNYPENSETEKASA
jgi:peptidoglycan/LPS O-acetylase OafA/YrhL